MNGYPITQNYGYDPTYPLNGGYHKGIDYGCPVGTPVVVNGVQVGLSGRTGAVTGPHLHVGKWVGGKDVNPGNYQGFTFNSASVYDTGYDATNGNFVRLTADGALWVYLHLSQINVTKGQVLKGGSMAATETINQVFLMGLRRNPDPGAITTYSKTTDYTLVKSVFESGERGQVEAGLANTQAQANKVPALAADVAAKQSTITQQTDQINTLTAQNADKAKVIEAQNKIIADLQANPGTPVDPDSVVITKDSLWDWFKGLFKK